MQSVSALFDISKVADFQRKNTDFIRTLVVSHLIYICF